MPIMSTYLQNAILNATLRNTSYSSPAKVYLALYTNNPGVDNSGIEVSGNNYARIEIAFDAPSSGTTSNTANILTNVASGTWGTITHFGIMDSLTSGHLLYFGAIKQSRTITNTGAIYLPAGDLDITLE